MIRLVAGPTPYGINMGAPAAGKASVGAAIAPATPAPMRLPLTPCKKALWLLGFGILVSRGSARKL